MSRLVSIGNVTSRVETWDPLNSMSNEPFHYIDISSVDRESKQVSATQLILPSDAPSRARQIVKSGDLLVSTVRPNLNAVAEIPVLLDGATASTGYCVLRPDEAQIDSRYLYFWVRSSGFINEMVKRATGASYPAVSDKIVKDSTLPLPPLPEQKRIAAILDKADSIRRKRQEAVRLTEELLRSVFLDMFGDPVANPKGWDYKPLDTICMKITDGEHLNPSFVEDGFPIVMANNVRSEGVIFDGVKYVSKEDFEKFTKKCKPEQNDILVVSRGATIGRCTIVDTDRSFCLMGSTILLKTDKEMVLPAYLNWLLQHPAYQAKLYTTSSASAQQAIYLSHIKELTIPIPPLKVQQLFSSVVSKSKKVSRRFSRALVGTDNLFNSLLQRAFKGEL